MLAVKQYNLYDSFSESAVFKIDDVEGYYGGEIKYSPEDGITGSINCFCDQPLFTCEDSMQPFYVRAAFSDGKCATLCKCFLSRKFITEFNKTFYFSACYIIFDTCFSQKMSITGFDVVFNSWEEFYLGKIFLNKNIENNIISTKINDDISFSIYDKPEYGLLRNYVFSCNIDEHRRISRIIDNALKEEKKHLGVYTVRSKSLIHVSNTIKCVDINSFYICIRKIAQFIFVLTGVPTGPMTISLCLEEKDSNEYSGYSSHPFLFQPEMKKNMIDDTLARKGYAFEELFSYRDIEHDFSDILVKFFDNYTVFANILDKITYNQRIGISSKFTVASNIDAIAHIANIKEYSTKKKYDECIDEYAFDALKNYLRQIFSQYKKNIGALISDLRSSVVHPTNQEYMDILNDIRHRSPFIDNILALVSLNYLQESIGIPEELRCKFQKYWLDIYSSYEYVEYDRPDGEK